MMQEVFSDLSFGTPTATVSPGLLVSDRDTYRSYTIQISVPKCPVIQFAARFSQLRTANELITKSNSSLFPSKHGMRDYTKDEQRVINRAKELALYLNQILKDDAALLNTAWHNALGLDAVQSLHLCNFAAFRQACYKEIFPYSQTFKEFILPGEQLPTFRLKVPITFTVNRNEIVGPGDCNWFLIDRPTSKINIGSYSYRILNLQGEPLFLLKKETTILLHACISLIKIGKDNSEHPICTIFRMSNAAMAHGYRITSTTEACPTRLEIETERFIHNAFSILEDGKLASSINAFEITIEPGSDIILHLALKCAASTLHKHDNIVRPFLPKIVYH